jgi:hypothetical protein
MLDVDLSFYLTQRLTRTTRDADGFDRLFRCEYMGSSEFEFGAVPQSLRRMRERGEVTLHVGEVTREGVTVPVFVVGHREHVEAVPAALTTWLSDEYPRSKEVTHFPEQVDGTASGWARETDAWWSLNSDVMWTLDEAIAERLLFAVTGARVT